MALLPLRRQLQLARPLPDVIRYLADFSTIVQWDPGVFSAHKKTPGAPRVGSRFALTLNVMGKPVPMTYVLSQLEQHTTGALLVLDGQGDGFSAQDRLTLTARSDGGTDLNYAADLDLDSVPGWMSPLLGLWGNRLAELAMRGLQRALDEDGPEHPSWLSRAGERLVLPGMLDYTRRGWLRQHSRGLTRRLDGRKVGITGITSGLGLTAACELARLGARLVLVGRGQTRLASAAASIRDFAGEAADLQLLEADLSTVADARQLLQRLHDEHPDLDVWINNAGALFDSHALTADGHERALMINCIAPALLARGLAPALAARSGRIINVVSGGLYTQGIALDDMNFANEPYNGAKAYARAKRALLDLSRLWSRQPASQGMRWLSMHPGWAATPGVASALPEFNRRLGERLRPPHMGADTMVWLASHPALNDPTLSGSFWFDRAQRPSALLPKTETSAENVAKLEIWFDEVVRTGSGR